MTDLAKLVVRLEAQTAQYMQQLDRANSRLARFDKQASVSARNIGKGLAAAAVLAGTAIAAMTKQAIDSADQLNKMSQATGISTEALSELQYAASLSDVSIDQLSTNLRKLQKAQADAARGSETAAKAFKALGLSATNADGSLKDSDELLLEIADKFATLEDGAAKAALAQELFGRSGAAMIPFLNQGRKGIEALRKEAQQFGLVVTTEAGQAAEQFNDNLTRLGAVGRGVANQVQQALVPTLNVLTEKFIESSKAGGSLQAASLLLADTLKLLVSGGVIVKSVFQQLGRVIYGVGAALMAVVEGDFAVAQTEIIDTFADIKDNVKDDVDTIQKVWDEAMPALEQTAGQIDDAFEDTIIFDDDKAGAAAERAAASALEAIKGLEQDLRQQVATYGAAENAVIKYRLAHGDLAEQIKTAGPDAQAYADSIQQQADALEALKTQEEQQKLIQEETNALLEEGKQITESVRTAAEKYADTVEHLTEMLQKGAITQATFDRAVDEAKKTMEKAEEEQNAFLKRANENVQDILAGGIETAISDGVKEGAKGALDAFMDMITKMAAQALAAKLADKLFGGGGMGSGGGLLDKAFTWFGGLFGGGRDSGGRGQPGTAYLIGTGAQPEMFIPDSPGHFIPAGAMAGGGNVTQNIYVEGSVNQRTARQMEVEASRRQRVATMRLG